MEHLTKVIQKEIEALETLRVHYMDLQEGYDNVLSLCPLCLIHLNSCDSCGWMKYKGIHCDLYVKQYNPRRSIANMRNGFYIQKIKGKYIHRPITQFKYHKRWVSDRIRDLQKWIESEKKNLKS